MMSMHFRRAATLLLLIARIAVAARIPKTQHVVPGAFIVEFAHSKAGVSHATFYKELAEHKLTTTPRINLNHKLFLGASFTLDDGGDDDEAVDFIKSMGMVRNIWPVKTISMPKDIFHGTVKMDANHGNMQKRGPEDGYPPHVMSSVDILHAEGNRGQGVRVAIIDSGVDYTHPALGGAFGPGHKISFGYDLVGDNYTGSNKPVGDKDPMDCDGHGTHVTGILGADSNPFNFTGVAPDASFGMYRVFGCEGDTTNDVLIAAFNMAFDHGVDVISASIGGDSGWSEDPWAVAVSRIVAAGVPCVLSAGNTGEAGLFNTSTAAIGKGVTSVGSVDSITTPTNSTLARWFVNGTRPYDFGYSRGTGSFNDTTWPLYATSKNASVLGDACSPLPTETPDLSTKIVLVRRGGCPFAMKSRNVAAFGGLFVFFYNSAPQGTINPDDNNVSSGCAMVSADQGAEWVKLLAASTQVYLTTFSPENAKYIYSAPPNLETGGYMSTFSSWGPTFEVDIAPTVSAPGGNILSTWPRSLGSYATLSGTSMSTPYIAGVIAIMKQVYGKNLDPESINSLLSTTAKPVAFNDGSDSRYSSLAPVVQQGGGLVDAYAAVHAGSIVHPSSISFNDTRHFLNTASFIIRNLGDTPQTYTFFHRSAFSVYAFAGHDDLFPTLFPPRLLLNEASLEFEVDSITIAPQDFDAVKFSLTPPPDLDATLLPVYSGFIAITGSSGELYTLPYAGIAADLTFGITLMDTLDGYPYLTTTTSDYAEPVKTGTIFTVPNKLDVYTQASLPSVAIILTLGTAYLDVNVVPEGSEMHKGLGSMLGFPQTYVNGLTMGAFPFYGFLENGKPVPAGNYTLLVRVLRLSGDPNCIEDWETYSTLPFTLKFK